MDELGTYGGRRVEGGGGGGGSLIGRMWWKREKAIQTPTWEVTPFLSHCLSLRSVVRSSPLPPKTPSCRPTMAQQNTTPRALIRTNFVQFIALDPAQNTPLRPALWPDRSGHLPDLAQLIARSVKSFFGNAQQGKHLQPTTSAQPPETNTQTLLAPSDLPSTQKRPTLRSCHLNPVTQLDDHM